MRQAIKIDTHTHILPRDIPDFKARFGYGGFITLDHCRPCAARMLRDDGTFFRDIEANCWDPVRRLEDCQRTLVDVQVLSTVPVMFSYWAKAQDGLAVAEFLNDHLAGVVAIHPKRFVGLGTVPLQDTTLAIKEMRRCVRDLGLKGVQIGTHVNGRNLDDPVLFDFFAAAAELGAAIFVHPWDMLAPERMPRYWLPWLVGMPTELAIAICSLIFGGVFERLPHLRVAFAHGGGAFPATLGRIAHGFDARPDLCAVRNAVPPAAYLGRFWVDSLVHDARTLRFILEVFGEQRVMLGSDYPFPLGESHPGQLIESLQEMPSTAHAQLLGENALAWLGMDYEAFATR